MKVIHELKACSALKTLMGMSAPFIAKIERYGVKR